MLLGLHCVLGHSALGLATTSQWFVITKSIFWPSTGDEPRASDTATPLGEISNT